MIEVEAGTCGRCKQTVYLKKIVNLLVACDPTPLEADEALTALVGGEQLWRLTLVGSTPSSLSPARPAVLRALRGEPGERPTVLREHPCGSAPVYRPISGPVKGLGQPTPSRPPAGRTAPFSGPSAATSSVRSADRPRSESRRPYLNTVCDVCRDMIGRSDHVGIQLGERWIWIIHDTCGRTT